MFKQMWIYWLLMLLVLFLTINANRSVLADVLIEPVHDDPQDSWVDPNEEFPIQDYFTNKNGLKCENQLYTISVKSLKQPARKCQMPDGTWMTILN